MKGYKQIQEYQRQEKMIESHGIFKCLKNPRLYIFRFYSDGYLRDNGTKKEYLKTPKINDVRADFKKYAEERRKLKKEVDALLIKKMKINEFLKKEYPMYLDKHLSISTKQTYMSSLKKIKGIDNAFFSNYFEDVDRITAKGLLDKIIDVKIRNVKELERSSVALIKQYKKALASLFKAYSDTVSYLNLNVFNTISISEFQLHKYLDINKDNMDKGYDWDKRDMEIEGWSDEEWDNKEITVHAGEDGKDVDTSHILSTEKYKKVVETIDKYFNEDFSLMAKIALKSGLRKSEILGLCWGDVNVELGKISVYKKLNYAGKGNGYIIEKFLKQNKKRRTTILFDSLVKDFDEYRLFKQRYDISYDKKFEDKSSGDEYDLIFRKNGEPFKLGYPQYWMGKLREEYSLNNKTTFHKLRGSFVSYCLNELNLSMSVVSKWVGHNRLETTLLYYYDANDKIEEYRHYL